MSFPVDPVVPATRRHGRRAGILILAVLLILGLLWAVVATTRTVSADGATDGDGMAAAASSASATSDSSASATSDSSATAVPSSSTPQVPDPAAQPIATEAPPAPAATESSAPNPDSEAQLAATDQPVAAPVKLDQTATVKDGITAEVSGLEAVQGEARGIGEISGPSVRFTLTIHNQTKDPISTNSVVVNVRAGTDDIPANSVSGPAVVALPESIAAGESGTATYVYLIPVDQRSAVRIYLNYQANSPIAAFEGAAPQTEGKP
ncbi:hypothetical protein IV500_02650 [Paeniglutamicibacter antarcticus]|uniref:DUF4352 domain-containing protein n=1 Tax=Arthrobacter terrae TaxID=2935737 RepID=A0A931CNZ7_9MICC|nr:hypothetical protein [Arthrobacter terrae]MBG0738331.1 hypothetical protein [Arthrobacter terrae]